VLSDSTNVTSCSAANQFIVGAAGGTTVYTNTNRTTGVHVGAGGGSWASVSDRHQKNGFGPVDPRDVLERLVSIPVTTWRYNEEVSGAIHMGPMAQDFYEKFQLGDDDRSITSVDADGVQVAAIQGMYSMMRERDVEIKRVEAENAHLRHVVESMEARLAKLEAVLPQR
jgi:hypothetical protein